MRDAQKRHPIVAQFGGTRVIVEPLRPRYTLPSSVPTPPGMTREEFAAWSAQVCGYQAPLVQDGQFIFMSGTDEIVVNERTFEQLKQSAEFQEAIQTPHLTLRA